MVLLIASAALFLLVAFMILGAIHRAADALEDIARFYNRYSAEHFEEEEDV